MINQSRNSYRFVFVSIIALFSTIMKKRSRMSHCSCLFFAKQKQAPQSERLPLILNLLFLFRQHFPHCLHKLGAGYHHVMPAAAATDTKIHARAGNFPIGRAARMGLFHPHNVANFKFRFFNHLNAPCWW